MIIFTCAIMLEELLLEFRISKHFDFYTWTTTEIEKKSIIEFYCLLKVACIVGGFWQTVTTSSEMHM